MSPSSNHAQPNKPKRILSEQQKEKNRLTKKAKRDAQTPAQKELEAKKRAAARKSKFDALTLVEKQQYREKERLKAKARRAAKTPDQKNIENKKRAAATRSTLR